MGNWISGTQDPETDVSTPQTSVLSLHQKISIDPRSPTTFFTRTPILVCDKPNPILDPRSPSLEINRTPLYCSYHKENEVTTTHVPQSAAVYSSSPIVTKIEPLCFEGASEWEEEEESESSYLSVVSEQNISTHNSSIKAEPYILGEQMMHLVAESPVTDKMDICTNSVSKLDNQGDDVNKPSVLDNFSHNVPKPNICSDNGHLSLNKEVSNEIPEEKEKETENENLEKNSCSGDDRVTDVVSDVLSMNVQRDGSYISSNTTTGTCTTAVKKQQFSSVGVLDQKERNKVSNIPLAVKKKTRTEADVGLSAFDNCHKKTLTSLHQHNMYKKTGKAIVAGGGGGVRSPLQSRNCGSATTGNNRYRSSLAKGPARANINTTSGGGVKTVSKPIVNWGFESGEVKSVHDKENMSIQLPK